jgi:hypothetical protein
MREGVQERITCGKRIKLLQKNETKESTMNGTSRHSRESRGAGLGVNGLLIFGCFLLCLIPACAYIFREAIVAYVEVNSHFSHEDIEIEIYKSFIERYKNRVTIDTTFRVDVARKNPNPAFMDGDLHFAGRTPQVGLPTVGEIINAASEEDAIDLIHKAEKTGQHIKISGVWRLWPEHAGSAEEEQGERLSPLESSNPDHVFEIHPVTRIDKLALLNSFHAVKGFKPGNAATVFKIYENVHCRMRVKAKTVSLVTRKGLYNDVEFLMEVAADRQKVVDDGRFVTASVRDLKGRLLVKNLRMVFMRDTPPEIAVRKLRRGDRLHVYGIPRVDFAEVARRAANYKDDPELLVRNLPYEIIIIGFFPSPGKVKKGHFQHLSPSKKLS